MNALLEKLSKHLAVVISNGNYKFIQRIMHLISVILFVIALLISLIIFVYAQKKYNERIIEMQIINFVNEQDVFVNDALIHTISDLLTMSLLPSIQVFLNGPGEDLQANRKAFDEIKKYGEGLGKHSLFFISDTDKKFYYDTGYVYTLDIKHPSSHWYDSTLYGKDKFNVILDYDEGLKQFKVWVNVPVYLNGKPVGIVGSGININEFVNSKRQNFVVFNKYGEILLHKETQYEYQKRILKDLFPELAQKMLDFANDKNSTISIFSHKNNHYIIKELPFLKSFIVTYVPSKLKLGCMEYNFALFGVIIIVIIAFITFNIFVKSLFNALNNKSAIVNSILKSMPIPMVYFNEHGFITYMSNYVEKLLKNRTANYFIGKNILEFANDMNMENIFTELEERKGNFEIIREIEHGEINKYFKITMTIIRKDSTSYEKLVYFTDVSEELNNVNIDALTGVAGKRYFIDRAKTEFLNSIRDKNPMAFLVIDIDSFREINDVYGYDNGDAILKGVAQVIAKSVKRSADILGRLSDEKFAIVLHDTDIIGAMNLSEKIREEVEKTEFTLEANNKANVTISVGVYSKVPTKENSIGDFLKAANDNLYRAKISGKNKVEG